MILKVKIWLKYQPVLLKLKEYMDLRGLDKEAQKRAVSNFFKKIHAGEIPKTPELCISDLEYLIAKKKAIRPGKYKQKTISNNYKNTSIYYSD